MPDVFVSETKNVRPVKKQNEKPIPPYVHDFKGRSHGPLSSFNYFPKSIKFIAKDSEEKIVLMLRRHPITNVRWVLIAIILYLAPLLLRYFPLLDFMPANFQFVTTLLWYLVATAYVFESFLDWFFSVFIITDERVFDVDFVNLIYRQIAEANIDQIQDVTVQMGGVVRTMFDYGDIYLQTASEVPNIEFEAIPHPDRVSKILRELRVEEEQEKLEGRVR